MYLTITSVILRRYFRKATIYLVINIKTIRVEIYKIKNEIAAPIMDSMLSKRNVNYKFIFNVFSSNVFAMRFCSLIPSLLAVGEMSPFQF